LGDLTDAAFILFVVLLNAALGCYQEWRAERSAAALQGLLRIRAKVKRDGVVHEFDAAQLVPGDIVLLESGWRVPADLRLLRAQGLLADEAFLTGESLPVEKTLAAQPAEAPVSDRKNLCFAGAIITAGRAEGVVVATGLRTEVGKIAAGLSQTTTAKPPLLLRMERFAHQISLAVLVACILLGGIGLSRGMPLSEVFFLAVALAVSAIPEGLPVAITVALSIATARMAKRNVVVRRLTAVEGLGSCTFIASDKTGTLTLNQQRVESFWLANPDFDNFTLSRAALLASESVAYREAGEWRFEGDAVDVACWVWARDLGLPLDEITGANRLGIIPFESERAYSAAFTRAASHIHVALKGAPEVVIRLCGLSAEAIATVQHEMDSRTAAGERVLAVAQGLLDSSHDDSEWTEDHLPRLELIGLLGFIDPPRLEAREAVLKCRDAGIEVAMITGDHPRTAAAIAGAVGLAVDSGPVLTGADLNALGSPEGAPFAEAVSRSRVFARVSPLQKLQIVNALRKLGHFVAVTGDGVNDAPALKAAHIGVAMGSGTDVAKETASLIVTDDNFASIEAGVEEGRFAYDNIRKVSYLLIATGLAEVLLFALTLISGLPLPLLAVQLLWLNLVTNGIQDVALAFEKGEPQSARRPPRRPTEGIFNRLMIEQAVLSASVTTVLAYVNFYLLLNYIGLPVEEARSRLLLLMVLIENFQVLNCRSEYVSIFRTPISRNWTLFWGVLAAQGLHIFAMYFPPFQRLLRTGPVSLHEWLIPFAMASVILVVMEIFKVIKHGRAVAWPAPGEA
jgi:calcium-translocating P-type ATPase